MINSEIDQMKQAQLSQIDKMQMRQIKVLIKNNLEFIQQLFDFKIQVCFKLFFKRQK
jgi:two-component sensor histidine kinase